VGRQRSRHAGTYPCCSSAPVKPRILQNRAGDVSLLELHNLVVIEKNDKGRHHPMPTEDGFPPDYPLPRFLAERADEPQRQDIGKAWDVAVISPRILKTSIVVTMATVIGIGILWVGNPGTLFADVSASLVEILAPQGRTSQSPIIQSTADAQASPPFAGDALTHDETAAAIRAADQSQTEISEPPSEALLKQFEAWAAKEDALAQVKPVQPVQDAPAQGVQNAQAPVRAMQKHRRIRPIQNARAETRPEQNPRKKVRREQNARVRVRSVQDARAQDRSAPNARPTELWRRFDWHD
jgi:hypothetical protein